MRAALAAFLLVACGHKRAPHDDGPPPGDEAPPPLPRCGAPVAGANVTARKIGTVLGGATLATAPQGDARLFVLEQRGAIRIFDANLALLPDPFLDISADAPTAPAPGAVAAGGEQGLLGLAFHPDFATNGTFFVFYTTRKNGVPLRDVLVRCHARGDVADPASCVEVLGIPDFAQNHNGGMLEFGADGLLYIGTGDGGGANDPNRNGQALVDSGATVALLGKILRIDVDHPAAGKAYGIPADNPFGSEIFIRGVRNPWRWTFDRATGDMWIADVGQDRYEELDVLRPAQQKGANLGWSMYEGTTCFHAPCDPTGITMAQDIRSHSDAWLSVIGGQVYHGACYPDLAGWYYYTDYNKHGLSKARLRTDDTLEIVDLPGSFPPVPSSIHEDGFGELFETDANGNVYHLEAAP